MVRGIDPKSDNYGEIQKMLGALKDMDELKSGSDPAYLAKK